MNNKIKIRYEFEYSTKTSIYSLYQFDYLTPKELFNDLKFSSNLSFLCGFIGEMYDETINWNSPHDGLYLDPEFIKIFIDMEKYIYDKLLKEQGENYGIIYNQSWLRRDYENKIPLQSVLIQH